MIFFKSPAGVDWYLVRLIGLGSFREIALHLDSGRGIDLWSDGVMGTRLFGAYTYPLHDFKCAIER